MSQIIWILLRFLQRLDTFHDKFANSIKVKFLELLEKVEIGFGSPLERRRSMMMRPRIESLRLEIHSAGSYRSAVRFT
jgi:hypothetical protein